MKVLCIAAHPDDEVLGCGATMARLAREGHTVNAAILGEGITSRYDKRELAAPSLVQKLRSAVLQAAQVLGVGQPVTYDLPDNRFDTVPLLDIVKVVEQLVQRFEPEVIYTHHGGDLNIDHVFVNRAVLTATRPVPGYPVKSVYAFEVPSSSEWSFFSLGPTFQPNVYVDIVDTIELKVAAMQAYQSEARPAPHPRSPEVLRAIAQRWGSVAGLNAAEAFQLIRSIR